MNDINIACFMSCARTKNFSATAKEWSVSHQAVSRNIQKLEKETGYKLFIRSGDTVTLTKAGEFFLGLFKEMDARLEWANDYFYNKQSDRPPTIRISFVDWLGLPRKAEAAVRDMELEQPDVNIELYTGSEDFLLTLLQKRKTDMVIVPGRVSFETEESPDIFATPLVGTETLQLIYSSKYLEPDGSVAYDRLFSEKLLLFTLSGRLNDQFELLYREICGRHKCPPVGTQYAQDFNSVISEVVLGNCFTFAPKSAVTLSPPGALLSYESLEGISLADIPMACAWRLTQDSGFVLNYIDRICGQ